MALPLTTHTARYALLLWSKCHGLYDNYDEAYYRFTELSASLADPSELRLVTLETVTDPQPS